MHALEERLGDAVDPRSRARRDARALQRSAGSLPAARRLQHRAEDRDRAAGPRLHRPRTSSARPRRSPAAGRCASRSPSCCSASPTCCCSTSRPTTSTSRPATGSRSTSTQYPHAVILVSHDRFFLDAVVTRIADLTLRTLTDYVGNYSHYLVAHEARIEQLRKAKREQDEEVARVKMFIDRFRYQATKASQVQSRIKMLEKVVPDRGAARAQDDPLQLPVLRQERPHGARAEARAQGLRRPRRLRRLEPAHRARRPHRARRRQRRRQVDADAHAVGRRSARRRRRASKATTSSCSTSRRTKPRAWTRRRRSTKRWPRARRTTWCRRFGTSSAASCSRATTSTRGCACCRAASARASPSRACCCGPSNTLLLDEPTNHLDLDSKEVLLDALVDYGGTLIFVSHDRYFVERLATKIIEVGHGEAPSCTRARTRNSSGTRSIRRARSDGSKPRQRPRRRDAAGRRRGASGRTRGEASHAGKQARSVDCHPLRAAGARSREDKKKRRRRRRARTASRRRRRRARIDDLEARIADDRARDPRDRAGDVGSRVLRRPGCGAARHRSASGPDVGGRRPDAPVGRAAVRAGPHAATADA